MRLVSTVKCESPDEGTPDDVIVTFAWPTTGKAGLTAKCPETSSPPPVFTQRPSSVYPAATLKTIWEAEADTTVRPGAAEPSQPFPISNFPSIVAQSSADAGAATTPAATRTSAARIKRRFISSGSFLSLS